MEKRFRHRWVWDPGHNPDYQDGYLCERCWMHAWYTESAIEYVDRDGKFIRRVPKWRDRVPRCAGDTGEA